MVSAIAQTRLCPHIGLTIEPSEQNEVCNDGSEELVLTYFGLQVMASPTDVPQNFS